MISDEKIERLATIMAEVAVMKQEYKRRSMIYQYDEKCRVAKWLGVTFDEVDLPYVEWAELRTRFHKADRE